MTVDQLNKLKDNEERKMISERVQHALKVIGITDERKCMWMRTAGGINNLIDAVQRAQEEAREITPYFVKEYKNIGRLIRLEFNKVNSYEFLDKYELEMESTIDLDAHQLLTQLTYVPLKQSICLTFPFEMTGAPDTVSFIDEFYRVSIVCLFILLYSLSKEDYTLEEMKEVYGTIICRSEDLFKTWEASHIAQWREVQHEINSQYKE